MSVGCWTWILKGIFIFLGFASGSLTAAEHSEIVRSQVGDSQADRSTKLQQTPATDLNDQKPDPCRSTINAMSIIREEYHIFSGKWFWRVNERTGVVGNDPTKIQLMWYGLPFNISQIDAVYERTPNGKIVFFSGFLYWELDDNRAGKFPRSGRPLTELGLPDEVVQVSAAFTWPRDNRTYVIVGDHLWKLNASGSGVEGDRQRMEFDPVNLKNVSIDAAFKDFDGNVHFVQDEYFWTVTDLYHLNLSSRRLRNESDMFGCASPLKNNSLRIPRLGAVLLTTLMLLLTVCTKNLMGFDSRGIARPA